jgi:TFIIF-interacting CTD phosphatase-like protein
MDNISVDTKTNTAKTGLKKTKKRSITKNKIRPKAILDLDNTIICSEAEEELDFEKNKAKVKKFNFDDMDGYYMVFHRPGLQKFLNFLFKNFDVAVWTAASKDYALFIVEKIILNNKKNRKLDFILFSYHCDLSKKLKNGTKDLDMLWDNFKIEGYDKFNSVIFDDYDEVQNTNIGNCIPIKPFEFNEEGSENDDFLDKLIPKLKIMRQSILKNKKNKKLPVEYIKDLL